MKPTSFTTTTSVEVSNSATDQVSATSRGASPTPDRAAGDGPGKTGASEAPAKELSRQAALLEADLGYADRGWPTVPLYWPKGKSLACACGKSECDNDGKHPIFEAGFLEHGLLDATIDTDEIIRRREMFPYANIGIRTGTVSRLVVIDVDGNEGEASLVKLEAVHGALPATYEVKTGRGRQLYFMLLDGVVIPNSAGRLGLGLDVRGENGYVVAPPSRHYSGKFYAVAHDRDLAELPSWLIELLVGTERSTADHGDLPAFDPKTVLAGVPEGMRDDGIYRYACSLRARNVDQAEAEILVGVAAENCDPPFPVARAVEKVKRVWRTLPAGTSTDRAPASLPAAQKEPEVVNPPAEPVDGGQLLLDAIQFIKSYLVASLAHLVVIALWILHTHAFEAAETTPYLAVTSPEKRSGKTRVLEIVELLVRLAWRLSEPSEAALFRRIDAEHPTLLIDEVDAIFKKATPTAEGLRAILNAGYRIGGMVPRCVGVGRNFVVQDFSVFSPKILAGIGELPDTISDRSIQIRMSRRTKSEDVRRFRFKTATAEAAPLKARMSTWAAANVTALTSAEPDIPDELSDRMADATEPLLAIADRIGGDWPTIVREAIVELCGRAKTEDQSHGVILLTDLRNIFDEVGDKLMTEQIVAYLGELEGSPWGEWSRGKTITPIALARLLKPFGIRPKKVRMGHETRQGYDAADFKEVFERYLDGGSDA
jgi:hypothetical protein